MDLLFFRAIIVLVTLGAISGGNFVTTYAGSPSKSYVASPSPIADVAIGNSTGMCGEGESIYYTDSGFHVVQSISIGSVRTVAGTGGICGYSGDNERATSAR